jgi:hypothetical protein
MLRTFFVASLLAGVSFPVVAANTPGKSPDEILQAYIQAVGGIAAIDRIETREVHAQRHHGGKLTYFWQKPNKVLLVEGKKKRAYDGGSGWMLSSKKRVSRLPKGLEKPLEMDANSLRYVHLKQLYSDVQAAPPETVDDRKMDVLTAPNDLGATKFYFDQQTHLLARIEESGETSAYFKHATDFMDYKEIDGVKLPFRIVHDSTEPGGKPEDIRISKVINNAPIKPDMFTKPSGAAVVLGGKR